MNRLLKITRPQLFLKFFTAWLITLIWNLACTTPICAFAQTSLQVNQDELVQDFPNGLTFKVSLQNDNPIESVTLIYGTEKRSCQAKQGRQSINHEPGTKLDLEWFWDFERSGIIPPGTEIWWQWEIKDAEGNTHLTEKKTLQTQDQRYDWQELSRSGIALQWIQGSQSFGNELLRIAESSLEKLAREMGIEMTDDIRMVVYPTSEDVRDALLHTYEWTGGVALTEYNNILIPVSPGEDDWARDVIPHELAHLAVESRIFNCKGISLPTWLSEGLASAAEGPLEYWEEEIVTSALEDGTLPLLTSLERGFSADPDEATLSYTQSNMVAQFLILEYGPAKMGDLLNAIQSGLLIDEALAKVYGMDTAGLDGAWRVSLGFEPPPTSLPGSGEETRTPVPTLALPTSPVRTTPKPSPAVGLSPTLLPPTPKPTLTSTLPAPSLSPTPTPREISPMSTLVPALGVACALAFLVIVGIVIFILVRRKPSPPES